MRLLSLLCSCIFKHKQIHFIYNIRRYNTLFLSNYNPMSQRDITISVFYFRTIKDLDQYLRHYHSWLDPEYVVVIVKSLLLVFVIRTSM
jgi:hypothetical protein